MLRAYAFSILSSSRRGRSAARPRGRRTSSRVPRRNPVFFPRPGGCQRPRRRISRPSSIVFLVMVIEWIFHSEQNRFNYHFFCISSITFLRRCNRFSRLFLGMTFKPESMTDNSSAYNPYFLKRMEAWWYNAVAS